MAGVFSQLSHAATIQVLPSHDNTIFSEDDNSNALGALYVGVTPNSTIRRALVQFNVGNFIPAGATITGASLTFTQTKIGPAAGSGPTAFELDRVSQAWGEGTSSGAGGGNLPTPNDATWNYSKYATNPWTVAGGDFAGASATTTIGTTNGAYTFGSTPGLVADVQNWLDLPSTNFGWIFKSASETPTDARQFGSRETANPETLTVTYSIPEPATGLLFGVGAIIAVSRRSRRKV